MSIHTHSDPEERKHRNYSLNVAILSALLSLGALWVSWQSSLNAEKADQRSIRTEKEGIQQQVELWTIQALQNPHELWCSDVAKKILVEEKLLEADVTRKEWDQICAEVLELPPSLEVRRELISLLVSNPSQRDGIITAYHALYGDTAGWIDDIAEQTSR
jgi:hypothetical protein